METKRNVIVVGAGAAGLMAAVWAARSGAEVTILEAMERPGKKLLLTGNGRCNLTNLDPDLPERYYGTGHALARSVIQQFDAFAVRSFFEELGLLTTEKNGYVYPYCAQSSAVLETLLAETRRLKIRLKFSEKITQIAAADTCKASGSQDHLHLSAPGWAVKTSSWVYYADALILACGSKCIADTGSDGSGYTLAKALGHPVIPAAPALAPVTCSASYLQSVAGVRCRAKVSLYRSGGSSFSEDKLLACDTGELQWTRYGVSGIVIFQLSRFISTAPATEKMFLSIDLFPEFSREYLFHLLKKRATLLGSEKTSVLLSGMLNDKLIPVILAYAQKKQENPSGQQENAAKKIRPLSKYTCAELTDAHLESILRTAKQLRLTVTGTKSFDTCQVCAGGVDCRKIDPDTLESRICPSLYFAGELLDVDGPCGGYNLQWAWSSGRLAGISAARSS